MSPTTESSVIMQAGVLMALWYTTSLVTLFMNKHILSVLKADPNTLALTQMFCTMAYGAFKVYILPMFSSSGTLDKASDARQSEMEAAAPKTAAVLNRQFYRDMLFVGVMRFTTIFLGLISLKFVAVSFVETVKSSAPFFTVGFAQLILGERTSVPVQLSLVPVVMGLALCSAHELSFNAIGFGAALLNNGVDCVQNVFSKRLLNARLGYVQLQFYTSVAALVVQAPLWALYVGWMWWQQGHRLQMPTLQSAETGDLDAYGVFGSLGFCLFVDGLSFHLQSVLAYALMNLISPVTHSVANTVKRALLIWLSVLFFHNVVTPWSGIGTAMVILGVFLYGYCRTRFPVA